VFLGTTRACAATMASDGGTFTGLRRRRRTSRAVRVANELARVLITSAGIGTIIAVSLVCVFLVWVVVPLFDAGSITLSGSSQVHALEQGERPGVPAREPAVRTGRDEVPVHVGLDEYNLLGYRAFADTTVEVFRLDTGGLVEARRVFEDRVPRCASYQLRGGHAAFGFADGTVRLATVGFKTEYHEIQSIDPVYADMEPDEIRTMAPGVVQLTPGGQFLQQSLAIEVREPIETGTGSGVELIDLSMQATGPVLCTVDEDRVLRVHAVREIRNIMTQQTRYVASGGEVALPSDSPAGPPAHLVLEGRGDSALVVWADGSALRYDVRDKGSPVLAERLDLVADAGAMVTALTTLIGKTTIVVGESTGRVSTWFRVKPSGIGTDLNGSVIVDRSEVHPPVGERLQEADEASLPEVLRDRAGELLVCATPDAAVLVRQHVLPADEDAGAVRALASSQRDRTLAIGHESGRFELVYVTSHRYLAGGDTVPGGPVRAMALAPKNDGLVVFSPEGYALWDVEIPHPETTVGSIFGKVWYESAEHPEHVWQSTAGDDAFESKYSLVPLIFGTLKATLYTMLFGVPIALLGAVYTSEFLHPRTRARIKPTVEVMAGLPSVVLGFLAALVFAPFVEDVVPAVLAVLFVVPVLVLFSGFAWQLIPRSLAIRLSRVRLWVIVASLPIGGIVAWSLGRLAERVLFAGDVRAWLAWSPDPLAPGSGSEFASSVGGWWVLMFPLTALGVGVVVMSAVNPRLRASTRGLARHTAVLVHMGKFLGGLGAAIALAWGFGLALAHGLGLDPRHLGETLGLFDPSPMGTHIQRNSLIVGFVMGFAVIPIIYTIAEDALSAVPDHLRAASLGAGATQWQTAIRIVVPTAMSGIFSACMIGLGRAVGETMIVLMAAGNTPIMELNMFSGFRTLSANIAVELPEAVVNGTNYRMLFLAAFTLFAMTFVLNTAAEVVRQRFRKRAYQL